MTTPCFSVAVHIAGPRAAGSAEPNFRTITSFIPAAAFEGVDATMSAGDRDIAAASHQAQQDGPQDAEAHSKMLADSEQAIGVPISGCALAAREAATEAAAAAVPPQEEVIVIDSGSDEEDMCQEVAPR